QDGDATSFESRWACKPALGDAGSDCRITYGLGIQYQLSSLDIAMYKGDERTRTLEISIDNLPYTTWTSSGTTTGFETIELDTMGRWISIVGVLADSEWLSIMEVCLCDVAAAVAWSCESATLACSHTYLYPHKRFGSFEQCRHRAYPSCPGSFSSTLRGFIACLNDVNITISFRFVRVLEQVKIMIDDGEAGSDDDDTATNASGVEAGTLGSVTAGASFYDPSLAVDGGCDPSGCVADNTRDGDLSKASRWSCAPTLGGECTISYNLGTAYDLDELRLAMFKGTERQVSMEVRVDDALVTTWTSSGTTDGFEAIDLSGTWGQVLEITGVLDDSEWLSIIEAEIMVLEDGASPTPTTPSPSPAKPSPATAQPVTSTTGTLRPVGLIPLASTGGTSLERYHIKDGDMSTSWNCSGDPQETDDTSYDCILQFSMFCHRNIKQVKIGEP
ncbi:unnamed protein product, partial [Ectocarpus sp. 8 AP-2014]